MDQHEWFQGDGPCLVTLNGEMVSSLGVISGGSSRETGGLLRRRREILALEENLHALQGEFEKVQETRNVLCQDIEAVSAQFEVAISAIREKELHVFSVQKKKCPKDRLCLICCAVWRSFIKNARWKRLNSDVCRPKKWTLKNQLENFEHRRTEENALLSQAQDSLHGLDQESEDLTLRLNDIRKNYHTLNAQCGHEQSNRERLEREEENRKIRIQEIDQQLEQLFLQSRTSQEKCLKNEELVESLIGQKESKGEQLRDLQNRYAEFLEEVKRLDSLIGQARGALAQIFKSRGPIEGRLAEVRTKLQAVEETLTVTYEIPTDDLKVSQSQDVEENDWQDLSEEVQGPEQWREHLQRIRKKLERIGPINLAAIDEHVQLEERYQFLLAQEEDLAGSIQSLQEIIQRLNHTTNKLFAETFKELQVKFNEVFSALFAGGRAELVLVDESSHASEDNESESGSPDSHDGKESKVFKQEPGVEIVAQPPGKRLKSLSMLSGGEKTMTVMALLFASFLIRPSPFCVLDEVDAPLDETNVVRFGQFLRQMANRSQFIVITHNKRTMEIANSLFGVTMEEPGVSKLISVRLHDLQEVG